MVCSLKESLAFHGVVSESELFLGEQTTAASSYAVVTHYINMGNRYLGTGALYARQALNWFYIIGGDQLIRNSGPPVYFDKSMIQNDLHCSC